MLACASLDCIQQCTSTLECQHYFDRGIFVILSKCWFSCMVIELQFLWDGGSKCDSRNNGKKWTEMAKASTQVSSNQIGPRKKNQIGPRLFFFLPSIYTGVRSSYVGLTGLPSLDLAHDGPNNTASFFLLGSGPVRFFS
jgi:hypothetical protein